MSILIKGMEMPTSCHVCVAGYGGCCFVAPAESDGICPDHGRADFCPLVHVPDHGRLIDADALIEAYDFVHVGPPGMARTLMVEAPTIIPADKEGET